MFCFSGPFAELSIAFEPVPLLGLVVMLVLLEHQHYQGGGIVGAGNGITIGSTGSAASHKFSIATSNVTRK